MSSIAAVLLARADGTADPASLHSLEAACATARRAGLAANASIASVQGGWAVARNAAVSAAAADFVAFLDPGQACGSDWLVLACRLAGPGGRPAVWHPEAVLLHGGDQPPCWAIQPDIETAAGDWVGLAMHDPWTAASFAARRLHLDLPYLPEPPGSPPRLWEWNAAVVAQGAAHRPVPGTVHIARRRAAAPIGDAGLWRDRIGWARDVGRVGRAAPC